MENIEEIDYSLGKRDGSYKDNRMKISTSRAALRELKTKSQMYVDFWARVYNSIAKTLR